VVAPVTEPSISHSPTIRKQLDGIVEAAHAIFADALKIVVIFDEIGKRLGQQHVFLDCSVSAFLTDP